MANVHLIRSASWCKVVGDPESLDEAARALDKPLSFEVPGAMFAQSVADGFWDGRKRLVKKLRTAGGGLIFPAGLTGRALSVLQRKRIDATWEDARTDGPPLLGVADWHGPELRDYQQAAVDAVVDAHGGTIRLPTRAGKTVVAAALIARLGVRSLFLVPSKLLLHQTRRSFEACLPGLGVTTLGDGDKDTSGDVVVATVESLAARMGTRAFAAMQRTFGLVIVDECHHQTGDGDKWREAVLAVESPYKVGLSATVGLETDSDGQDLWLEGMTGPIVYSVEISDLIDRGFLVRPEVRFRRHGAPLSKGKWSIKRYGELIVDCEERNATIVREARDLAAQGYRVLIDVSQVRHGKLLAKLLRQDLPTKQVALLVGQTNDADRLAVTQAFREGSIRVLVATIMGEGVDVPEIEVVINAEGGCGEVATKQRLRNLTLCPGKTQAIVIELVDDHHKLLRDWTLQRLKIYRGERAFRIRVQSADPDRAVQLKPPRRRISASRA